MRRLLIAGLIALLGTMPALAGSVSRSVLDNGLTVLAVQSETGAMAGIALVVDASVTDEPRELHGVRPLLQQMIVLDHKERMSGRVRPTSAVIDARSAGLAVNTDWDFVEISLTTAAEELSEALDLIAESAFSVELTEESFDRATGLVAQAHDRSHQSPVQTTFDLFRAAFYGDHAMGRGLYGDPAQFENIELAAVQSFRDHYYVPANAWLCVVSPLPVQDAHEAVRQRFGDLPAAPEPPKLETPEPPSRPLVEVGESPDLGHASLVVGVPLPGYGDPSFHAGEMIGALLEGRGGRLRRDLGLLQALGLSIPTRLLDQHYPVSALSVPVAHRPYLAVHALSSPRQVERVRTGLLRHLLALREGTVAESELERARTRVINSHRRATARPADAALHLARRAVFGLGDADEAVAAIERITGEELSEVAREYFDRHAIGVQMPST